MKQKPKLSVCFTCVGNKVDEPEINLMYDCVVGPEEWLANAEANPNKHKALDLYEGPGYVIVKDTITELEKTFDLTVYIFSGGFGILRADDMIPSYSATFSGGQEDRVKAEEQKAWITAVTKRTLPVGTVCAFPISYSKPYQRCFGNLDDMILVQGTPEDREDLICGMIRVTNLLLLGIAKKFSALPPAEWPSIRGWKTVLD